MERPFMIHSQNQNKTSICKWLLILVALVALVCPETRAKSRKPTSSRAKAAKPKPPASLSGTIKRILPSIVLIDGQTENGGRQVGTGFCIEENRLFATAYHLVQYGKPVCAILRNGIYYPYSITLVAVDQPLDIAIIRVNEKCAALPLDSKLTELGDPVAICGFAFGDSINGQFLPSVSAGIVSSFRRSIARPSEPTKLTEYIQLDLLAEQGLSGAPVFRPDGRVVGIFTSRLNATQNPSTNLRTGFCVPVKSLRDLMYRNGLIQQPRITKPSTTKPARSRK